MSFYDREIQAAKGIRKHLQSSSSAKVARTAFKTEFADLTKVMKNQKQGNEAVSADVKMLFPNTALLVESHVYWRDALQNKQKELSPTLAHAAWVMKRGLGQVTLESSPPLIWGEESYAWYQGEGEKRDGMQVEYYGSTSMAWGFLIQDPGVSPNLITVSGKEIMGYDFKAGDREPYRWTGFRPVDPASVARYRDGYIFNLRVFARQATYGMHAKAEFAKWLNKIKLPGNDAVKTLTIGELMAIHLYTGPSYKAIGPWAEESEKNPQNPVRQKREFRNRMKALVDEGVAELLSGSFYQPEVPTFMADMIELKILFKAARQRYQGQISDSDLQQYQQDFDAKFANLNWSRVDKEMKLHFTEIDRGLRKLGIAAPIQAKVYRGTTKNKKTNEISGMTGTVAKGSTIESIKVLSTTESEAVAMSFAAKKVPSGPSDLQAVLIAIESQNRFSALSALSEYPHEEEVAFAAKQRFEVVSIATNPRNVHIEDVTLRLL
ncbi:hypothetical protein [Streptomyces spectabilis]|uniref:ADP ribosyltransferase domain-containing protein n=1 Tax=Streptomyces spectabilis TaxID=68270 RepID=A0A7W8B454_STRST|nr:hypothetical protein [Streptomyces spectabilis]MBB5110014.1 hypothetical protein [Streptomyces spectabilis]